VIFRAPAKFDAFMKTPVLRGDLLVICYTQWRL